MLGSLWLLLSVHIKQLENFAGAMNFVMFPMFFFSSALYPLWKLREGGSELLYYTALANPFTHAVELIRFALYGEIEPIAAAVVGACTVLFFLLAVLGYNPQRGIIRRARAAGVNWPRTRAISFRIFSSSAAVLVSRGRGIGTSPMTWAGRGDSRKAGRRGAIASSMSWVTRSVVTCRLVTSAASSSRRCGGQRRIERHERLVEHQQGPA